MSNEIRIDVTASDKATQILDATEKSAKKLESTLKSTGDTAKASAAKLDAVATATDEIDTIGGKATSSLGALSSGFELLGPSGAGAAKGLMTAALATDFLSGVGEGATLITENFRKTLDAIKNAAGGMGSALKRNAVAIAGVGSAIVAVLAVGAMLVLQQKATKDAYAATAQQLDLVKDRFGTLNRQQILSGDQGENLIRLAERHGVSLDTLTAAILGDSAAMAELDATQNKTAHGFGFASDSLGELKFQAHEYADQVAKQKTAQEAVNETLHAGLQPIADLKTGQELLTQAVDDATFSMKNQAIQLRAQTDPLFAMAQAERDVKTAKKELAEAVKEHGKNSAEAQAATDKLFQAEIGLAGAAADAAAGTGHLTAQQEAMLTALGLTKADIKAINDRLKTLKERAEGVAGDYRINLTLNESQFNNALARLRRRAAQPFPVGGYAHGGAVSSAQTGGARGLTTINEQGDEMVDLPDGSVVIPASQTANRLRSSGAGANGGRLEVEMVLPRATGLAWLDALIEGIRFKVHSEGGNDPMTYLRRS